MDAFAPDIPFSPDKTCGFENRRGGSIPLVSSTIFKPFPCVCLGLEISLSPLPSNPQQFRPKSAARQDLRCRVGDIQVHLYRGDLDPNTARLDRLACPGFRLLWRRAADRRARQFAQQRHQGLSV